MKNESFPKKSKKQKDSLLKKLTPVGAVALLLLTFSSCQKDKIVPDLLSTATTIYGDDNNDGAIAKSSNKHFVNHFPTFDEAGCYPPATNCLPVFIVRGSVATQNTSARSFITLKKAMTASSNGNGQPISNYFTSQEWRKIFPSLSDQIAQKIAEGNYKITSIMSTQSPGIEIFIVLPSSSDPVKFTNSEVIIAMQIRDKTL